MHEMQVGLPPLGGCILDPSIRRGSPPSGLTGFDPEQPPLASASCFSKRRDLMKSSCLVTCRAQPVSSKDFGTSVNLLSSLGAAPGGRGHCCEVTEAWRTAGMGPGPGEAAGPTVGGRAQLLWSGEGRVLPQDSSQTSVSISISFAKVLCCPREVSALVFTAQEQEAHSIFMQPHRHCCWL